MLRSRTAGPLAAAARGVRCFGSGMRPGAAEGSNRWTADGTKPVFINQADPEPDNIRPRDRESSLYYDFSKFRGYTRNDGFSPKTEAVRDMMELGKEDRRGNWLKMTEQMLADGAIGYLSEEDDEEWEHPEFHVGYKNASETYKAETLKDRCGGRPAYEWQIPADIPQLYGYQSIRSSVDVCSTPAAMANVTYAWSGNENTLTRGNQTITIVPITELAGAVEAADTVILPYAADLHLDRVRRFWSPTSRLAGQGCMLSFVWTVAMLTDGDWVPFLTFPTTMAGAYFGYAALAGINAIGLYNTFLQSDDRILKGVMASLRKHPTDAILADWMGEDVSERIFHTSDRDFCVELNKSYEDISRLDRLAQWIQETIGSKSYKDSPSLVPESYEDAIHFRRIDVMAHTLNNSYGDNIVVGVRDFGGVKSSRVATLLSKRLTGEVPMSIPLSFCGDQGQRVEVVFG